MNKDRPVAVFATLFPPAYLGGGPIRSTEALVQALPEGMRVCVMTSDRDLGGGRLPVAGNTWTNRFAASVYYASLEKPVRLVAALWALRRKRPGVLYFNSFFHPTLTILPQLLFRLGFWGKPIRLLAPRGEFGRAALGRRGLKKRLFIVVFRLLSLHKRVYWHASSSQEAADILQIWGPTSRVIISQNPTLLPDEAQSFEQSASGEIVKAIFLGRIVEHKGLLIALNALSDTVKPFRLDVFGAEEDPAYMALCRTAAASLPDHVQIIFHGPARPETVRRHLGEHDLMLMPTAGENFGHVIAESLSVSCPVMCSDSTPWNQTLESGGGWVIRERSSAAWSKALEGYLTESPGLRAKRRRSAGDAYNVWKKGAAADHVFTMLATATAHL